jgi:hypothetical protein
MTASAIVSDFDDLDLALDGRTVDRDVADHGLLLEQLVLAGVDNQCRRCGVARRRGDDIDRTQHDACGDDRKDQAILPLHEAGELRQQFGGCTGLIRRRLGDHGPLKAGKHIHGAAWSTFLSRDLPNTGLHGLVLLEMVWKDVVVSPVTLEV